jgi:hypothetical protein
MKRNTRLILFLLYFLFVPIIAATQIPGAQEQPQWAMPFFFEDGNGNRDTIWMGYDPEASFFNDGYDSIYNEWQAIDTNRFNVVICRTCFSPWLTTPNDSAWKNVIMSNSNPVAEIGFIKGRMPIKITWPDSLFYSDSLPYPNLSPAPIAKAIVTCDDNNPGYYNCPLEYEALTLTDSVLPQMTYPYQDSLVLWGDTSWTPNESFGGSLTIRIFPWDDFSYLGIADKPGAVNVSFFPNPVREQLNIENKDREQVQVQLFDLSGKLLFSSNVDPQKKISVPMTTLPPGIYLIEVFNENQIINHKIMKL